MENLHCFGIGASFRTLGSTATAAKLRVVRDLGIAATRKKADRICTAQMNSLRRPFGSWHARSYAKVLWDNWEDYNRKGIALDISLHKQHFQKEVRASIARKVAPYDIEERIRVNTKRWKFQDPPRQVTMRLINNFRAAEKRLPPAVRATYLRALWNGIPTTRRMRTCEGFKKVGCVFKCSERAEDSLEHYCRCPALQKAFEHVTSRKVRNLDDFFGTNKGLSDDERVECARRVRVTCRAIQLARGGCASLSEVVALEWSRT